MSTLLARSSRDESLQYRGNLLLEDISAPGLRPARYGLTKEEVMGHIHAVLPDGTVLTGMEAFRGCYSAIGLGFLMAPTGWPMLRRVFDRGYEWFANNRLKLTGAWPRVREPDLRRARQLGASR